MADRPILFSGSMTRALLDGRKSQTRRVGRVRKGVSIQDFEWDGPEGTIRTGRAKAEHIAVPFAVGDRVYVREAWRTVDVLDHVAPSKLKDGEAFPVDYTPIRYEADGAEVDYHPLSDPRFGKLRPGMFMPRWASRLTLAVTDVRVQRLQEISEADAMAEGMIGNRLGDYAARGELAPGSGPIDADLMLYSAYEQPDCEWSTAREAFSELWGDLNAARGYGWDVNPWVVAVSFSVHHANIDAMPAREAA